jgi:hypothetical protein
MCIHGQSHPNTAACAGAGYTDLGCYVYNTTGHLGSTDLTAKGANKMTPAECYGLSAAFDFFGLVNGSRCIGFTSLRQAAVAAAWNGSLVEDEDGGESWMHRDYCMGPCTGGGNATCGNNSTTMQLYARNKPVPQLAPAVPGEGQARGIGGGGGGGRGSGRHPRQG